MKIIAENCDSKFKSLAINGYEYYVSHLNEGISLIKERSVKYKNGRVLSILDSKDSIQMLLEIRDNGTRLLFSNIGMSVVFEATEEMKPLRDLILQQTNILYATF